MKSFMKLTCLTGKVYRFPHPYGRNIWRWRASAEDAGRGSGVKGGGERVATKIFVGACGFFFMLSKPQYAGIIFCSQDFLFS